MGSQTYPVLMSLMDHSDLDVRHFATQAAYRYKIREFIPALIGALDDPEFQVVNSAIRGLGELQAVEAAKDSGAEIAGVIAIVDREEGGREAIEAQGIPVRSLFSASELKQEAQKAASSEG